MRKIDKDAKKEMDLQNKLNKRPMLIIWIILMFINIIVRFLDVFITVLGTNIGFQEGNPLVVFLGMDSLGWLNLSTVIYLVLVGLYIFKKLFDCFKIYCYCLIFVNIVILLVVFSNISIMGKFI